MYLLLGVLINQKKTKAAIKQEIVATACGSISAAGGLGGVPGSGGCKRKLNMVKGDLVGVIGSVGKRLGTHITANNNDVCIGVSVDSGSYAVDWVFNDSDSNAAQHATWIVATGAGCAFGRPYMGKQSF